MIEIAGTCGFCNGAAAAFKKALQAVKENPGRRIVLYGRLLHNQDVIDALKEKGIVQKNSIHEFQENDILIIRAHGETKETFANLAERGLACIDCTCPKVRRIHESIAEKYKAGYCVVIIGEIVQGRLHPEVTASNSYCDNKGVIITQPEDIDAERIQEKNIFVIAQTTLNSAKFEMLSQKIQSAYPDCRVEIQNSLCGAQEKNHASSVRLAEHSDTMLVIGGAESANTAELYNKCAAVCADTRRIESRCDFYEALIKGSIDTGVNIGLTGGASTPLYIINECKQLLQFKRFYEYARARIKEKIDVYVELFLRDIHPLLERPALQFAALAQSRAAKLLRGTLVALGYKMTRKTGESYLHSIDLAASYEFFETAVLAHDDVFDKAGERRGVQTIHKKISDDYCAEYGCEQKERIAFNAASLAVCAGDWAFYFLNQMILSAYKNERCLAAVLEYFNNIVISTIKGEMLDIALPLEEQLGISHEQDIEDYVFQIDTLKTACYTTIGPLCLGLTLGGAQSAVITKMEELLACLGIAFQAKDDWLNIYGTAEQGKPLCNDISEFKMTFFYAEACKNQETKKALLDYYGKENLTNEDCETVRRIFENSGIKDAVEKIITENLEKCRALLQQIEFNHQEDRDILNGFILFLELRTR
ncbi:MAG: 4-hydroxy-3-methylbut-2-enyl diphosphate reductase [Spirochaetaceae bacterium]|jgi:4-hydroxy-3-methylbut-2-enyl diphosphate reductase|nr:4-hydroxy-3-methylbut-2-enyl diphosphate reductase [Spirochaetaceae bacterium]